MTPSTVVFIGYWIPACSAWRAVVEGHPPAEIVFPGVQSGLCPEIAFAFDTAIRSDRGNLQTGGCRELRQFLDIGYTVMGH